MLERDTITINSIGIEEIKRNSLHYQLLDNLLLFEAGLAAIAVEIILNVER